MSSVHHGLGNESATSLAEQVKSRNGSTHNLQHSTADNSAQHGDFTSTDTRGSTSAGPVKGHDTNSLSSAQGPSLAGLASPASAPTKGPGSLASHDILVNGADPGLESSAAQAESVSSNRTDDFNAATQDGPSFTSANRTSATHAQNDALPRRGSQDTSSQSRADSSNINKKPATFKALSVTRNFLAKAAGPTGPGSKLSGDIPSASGSSASSNSIAPTPATATIAPRPRLVAKIANLPGQLAKPLSNKKTGSAPDAQQVWNRNRAPQAHPKHLTDEELKQQYGIHLATRIQANADSKEAKWADIDDDDEDNWAPETIEWNDGTKITLPQYDPAVAAAEERAAAEAAQKKREEEQLRKAKAAAAAAAAGKPGASIGPNATVLKPRATLQLKSSSNSANAAPAAPAPPVAPVEKPASTPKSSVTGPAKSPWAPIPAIDKALPVEINPPPQATQPQRRPFDQSTREVPRPEKAPSHPPAMEIAADSFRRGTREAVQDTVGQLYNAQSGKYEIASGGRRNSMRRDSNTARPPALLQRPARPNETEHGNPGQTEQYRDQISRGSDGGPSQQARSSAPSGTASNATAQTEQRDDILRQKQLMKEKRELAIKRRKEQDEREEQEKKERIRKKMEELGLGPVSASKDQPANLSENVNETGKSEGFEAAAPGETRATEGQKSSIDQLADPASVKTNVSLQQKSPPKPPTPSVSGVTQQYGMIKVHGMPPREPLQTINDTLHAERLKFASTAPQPIHSNSIEVQPPKEGQDYSEEPLTNGLQDHGAPKLSQDRQSQPWKQAMVDQYKSWNGQVKSQDSPENVWATPSVGRALGNGTFDRTISRPVSGRLHDSPGSGAVAPLAPIGPPNAGQRSSMDSAEALGRSDSSILHGQSLNHAGSTSDRDGLRTSNLDFDGRRTMTSGTSNPISASSRTLLAEHDRTERSDLSTWANFHGNAKHEEAERLRMLRTIDEAQRRGDPDVAPRQQAQMPVINETWRQVKVGDLQDRTLVNVSQAQRLSDSGPNDLPSRHLSSAMDAVRMPVSFENMPATTSQNRLSRFFPRAPQFGSISPHIVQHLSHQGSPPPMDSSLQIAVISTPSASFVRLPHQESEQDLDVKPPTTVIKLPGHVGNGVAAPQISQGSTTAVGASWQEKFNGLFGTKRSNLHTEELRPATKSDFSITKEPLPVTSKRAPASVALPSQADGNSSDASATISKDPQDEEMLFEPESGSTPTIMFPIKGYSQPAWGPKRYVRMSQFRPTPTAPYVSAASTTSFEPPSSFTSDSLLLILVKLAGMFRPAVKTMSLAMARRFLDIGDITPAGLAHNNSHTAKSSQQATRARGKVSGPGSRSNPQHSNSPNSTPNVSTDGIQDASSRTTPLQNGGPQRKARRGGGPRGGHHSAARSAKPVAAK